MGLTSKGKEGSGGGKKGRRGEGGTWTPLVTQIHLRRCYNEIDTWLCRPLIYKVMCGLFNYEIANDLHRPSKSFKQFFREN